jgi:glycosyltransferase involved in cell wall biosynthesis
VSEFSARDIERSFGVEPDKVRVIHNGPGQSISPDTPPMPASELAALGLRRPFVLRMGGYTRRKNVPRLLQAWPDVRRRTDAQLALIGPVHPAREAHLADAPSLEGVIALDYLPSTAVPGLIRAAAAIVSPSLFEGFGLPLIEAMGAGVPVVAVRSGAAEEVCAEAGMLVDDDPMELADAIVRVLEDPDLGRQLIDRGRRRARDFSWERAAVKTVDVYRELQPPPG